jgi:isopenicillin N synthase-like dioxygenase
MSLSTVDIEAPDAPEQVDEAFRAVGFVQVVNHGIPDDLIEAVYRGAGDFFGLPLQEKLRWASPPEIERGYTARGTENFSYSVGLERPPDLLEAFTVARDSYPADEPAFATTDRHHFFAPNIWPDSAPALRTALSEYYLKAQRLAHRITSLFAVALGLDAGFFEPSTTHSIDTLRINWFEGLPSCELSDGQLGIGPHTDYGIVTILLADQVPALQVMDPAGEWRTVVPEPGALICNIGDLLAQWTNDRWRSTLHRVLPVTDDAGRRRSLPFFHEGNFDALIECLSTCTGPGNPPRYPPVVAGEHVHAKVMASRLSSDTGAGQTLGDRAASLADD